MTETKPDTPVKGFAEIRRDAGGIAMNIKNWLRPSIQQPRYIANMVKAIFKPSLETQKIIQEYWSTWNQVYKPEKKDDNK